MRVPIQLAVAGKIVRIEYPELIPGAHEDDADCYGEALGDGSKIRISRSKHTNEREVFATIMHELIHVSLAVTGVQNLFKTRTEETITHAIENSLAPLFCFNPDAKIKWKEIAFPHEED